MRVTPPKVAGPSNPIRETESGYEYRELSARDWCRGAHLDLDVSALAWCLASEAPNVVSYPQYAEQIARAVLNDAAAVGITAHQRVTMEDVPVRSAAGGRVPMAGHYGRQSGRWCASLQWPNARHLEIARAAVTEPADADGARRWLDLRVMDKGYQGGKKLEHDAESIIRRRWADGWAWVGPILKPDGELLVDPFVLWLGRRKRAGDTLEQGLAVVEDGRRRWRSRA